MFSYFSFYNIPVQFRLNEAALRKLFLQKSRELHPDFNTTETEQDAVLAKAAFNNKAYQTLSDEEERLRYILTEKGMLGDNSKNALPHSFLAEMMDINEQLMDLEMEDSPAQAEIELLKNEVKLLEADLYPLVEDVLNTENAENLSVEN